MCCFNIIVLLAALLEAFLLYIKKAAGCGTCILDAADVPECFPEYLCPFMLLTSCSHPHSSQSSETDAHFYAIS